MKFYQKLLGYLNPFGFLNKKTEEEKGASLRFMHGTNRLSIWMMLVAVVIMVLRFFVFN